MTIKNEHTEIKKEILNKLPEYLSDPMLIFQSTTVPGRIVVALELVDTLGINVVVPVERNAKKGRIDVHIVTSVYGKGKGYASKYQGNWFYKNIKKGNCIYVNKKQAAKFYQSAGLQLPMEGKNFYDLFNYSIKTEDDLVKYKRERPGMYQRSNVESEREIGYSDIMRLRK